MGGREWAAGAVTRTAECVMPLLLQAASAVCARWCRTTEELTESYVPGAAWCHVVSYGVT